MRILKLYLQTTCVFVFLSLGTQQCLAQSGNDSGEFNLSSPDPSFGLGASQGESVDSLVADSQLLFIERRPLDARAKLQRALQLAPDDYRPHFFLGVYYLTEVAHFKMADKYLSKAEELFRKEYGSELDGTLRPEAWRQNARLLQYLTEAKLNLDNYEEALRYANRFANTYWDDWFPGTKAWILMKLRRVDEAIQEAQSGVLRGADETRTYNILGILYSLKGNRRLALDAFKQAIKAELQAGSSNQAATPLNNSGEVYRELFQDDLAEASWLRALQLPDGCDHILPSLNLALLYIDQLRLFQAERTLADFEACFAQKSQRSDTEHRALLALARGKIALREGEPEKAEKLLKQAADREQWYGKIGTDPEDLQLSASLSLAQMYLAKIELLRDEPLETLSGKKITNTAQAIWLRVQAWWQLRKARQIAVSELHNFEDLYIRNTDSMLEYPTLGIFFSGVSIAEVKNRIAAMREEDKRKESQRYYDLFLLEREVASGASKNTVAKLEEVYKALDLSENLLRAQALSLLIRSYEQQRGFFSASPALETRIRETKEELFNLLPSYLRFIGSNLPTSISIRATSGAESVANNYARELTRVRFADAGDSARYELVIEASPQSISLTLSDKRRGLLISRVDQNESGEYHRELITQFIDKCFGYRTDASSSSLPKLEILEE